MKSPGRVIGCQNRFINKFVTPGKKLWRRPKNFYKNILAYLNHEPHLMTTFDVCACCTLSIQKPAYNHRFVFATQIPQNCSTNSNCFHRLQPPGKSLYRGEEGGFTEFAVVCQLSTKLLHLLKQSIPKLIDNCTCNLITFLCIYNSLA